MKAWIKIILRDPLLHFLIGGLALYAATQYSRTQAPEPPITISADQQETLAEHFSHAYLYPPSAEELANLVNQAVVDEALYREGLHNGLAKDDPIVRKRLIQKMNFLLEGAASPPPPSTAELSAYFEANKARYRQADKISFHQVFFDKERRPDTALARANAALATLHSTTSPSVTPSSDPFIRGNRFNQLSPAQIARIFGEKFAETLAHEPRGKWIGPISSPYGEHVVMIDAVTAATTPNLISVREQVYADWLHEQTQKRKDVAIKERVARYPVVVEAFDVNTLTQPQVSLNQTH